MSNDVKVKVDGIVKDIKGKRISKSEGIRRLYKLGLYVDDVRDVLKDNKIKIIYNMVYNVIYNEYGGLEEIRVKGKSKSKGSVREKVEKLLDEGKSVKEIKVVVFKEEGKMLNDSRIYNIKKVWKRNKDK